MPFGSRRRRERRAFTEAVADAFRTMYESVKVRGHGTPHSVVVIGTMGTLSASAIAGFGGWLSETEIERGFPGPQSEWLMRLRSRLFDDHYGLHEALCGVTAPMVLHFEERVKSPPAKHAAASMQSLLELSPPMYELVSRDIPYALMRALRKVPEGFRPPPGAMEPDDSFLKSRVTSLWALTDAVIGERPDLSDQEVLTPWMQALLVGQSDAVQFSKVQSHRLGVSDPLEHF